MEQLVDSIISLGYHYVLIDCPAGIDVGFINAISPAREALIVTTPEITSIRCGGALSGCAHGRRAPEGRGPARQVAARQALTWAMPAACGRPAAARSPSCPPTHPPRPAPRDRDADRVAGLLEANNIYNVKLLVNRVRPDMIQSNDMMSVKDVQV
jgi:septum formation inhibitor-activating ATPase MinD